MTSGARQALGFLTPLGGATSPSAGALTWFPAVGIALGATLGGLWWMAGRMWPPLAAAAIVVVADLTLTGMLHLDGLADAADGLLPHLARERRLEVMRQPDVGAFGVGVTAVTLLVRWSALASLHPAPLLLAALWCLSRTAMAVVVATVPYARVDGGGLATAFRSTHAPFVPAALGVIASAALAITWRPLPGALVVATAGAASAGVVVLALRRLGGFTGDVLGAAGIVGETAGLLVAAARWGPR